MAEEQPVIAPLEVPLPSDGRGSLAWWLAQIHAAKDKREKVANEAGWKDRIQSYLGKTLGSAPAKDTIVVPKDYANVEQKKAQLFAQVPELHLEPKQDAYAAAAPIAQAIVREYLGPHQVNAEVVMGEVIFDALCPSGLMCSKIGYESVQDGTIEVPTGAVDPLTGGPKLDPVTQQPETQAVPHTIYERYFWERVSPLKTLIPADFHGSEYNKAPWLAFEFDFDPQDETGLNPTERINERVRSEPGGQSGVEVWYRPAHVDGSEKHPEKYRCLLIKNDQAVKHGPSPYQKVLPDGTILGVRRNPIRIGALRYVSDSAYPPSDCAMSAPQVEELSKGRSQMIQQRDRNVPMRAADKHRVDQPTIDKITKGEYQAIILTDGPPNEIFAQIAQAQFPRENFEFNRVINQDLVNTWALATTPGEEVEGTKTATEASLFQGKTDVRLRRERNAVLRYFLAAAEDIFALIQLFADDTDYVRVVGADGVAKLQAWDKSMIAGEYAFTAKPDSAVFQDQALQKKHATETFQFLAPSPFINQQELAAWYLRQQDMEPAKFIAPPKPPEPDQPKINFSFTGQDLNPLSPQAPLVVAIMVQLGIQVPPDVIAASKNIAAAGLMAGPHGLSGEPSAVQPGEARQDTTAPMQPALNKHANDLTGRNNSGLAPGVQ